MNPGSFTGVQHADQQAAAPRFDDTLVRVRDGQDVRLDPAPAPGPWYRRGRAGLLVIAAAVIAAGTVCGPLALSASAAPSARAGNPLAGLTADQIASRAATDFTAASSFHYHGSGKDSGQTISISMSVTHKGGTGFIGYGSHGGFAILDIGKTVWIQPDDKFWEYVGVPASEVPLVHGLWLLPAESAGNTLVAALAPLWHANRLLSLLAPQLTGLVKGKTIKISGHRALRLQNMSGLESIYVSISSKPEILRISNDGTLTFSRYGARVTLTPPPPSDVITLPGASSAAYSLEHLL
jgi:hypothetical protein